MGWIYLAALEDFQSPCQNGLNQSPIVKSTHIVRESCSAVYPTEHSLMRQSGMISKRCRMMGEIGPESISSMEGSPARTSALQAVEQAWKEREVDLFTKYTDSPDSTAPPSYSRKMSQQLQHEVV